LCYSRYHPGFLGRYLALHIHENNLASEVRLVDKLLPQLAWLAPEFSEACSADKFVQADASRERTLLLLLLFLSVAVLTGVWYK
jgi:nucleoside-diphosphate-sugar epimerase